MKMLLTGGSGNLGQTLVPKLLYRGDTPVILDVRPPRHLKGGALFIEGSAVREGPKVCRLPAGGRWIRTLGPPKGTKVVIEGHHADHDDRYRTGRAFKASVQLYRS